ncbi:MAG: TrmH family RNA methyltransferase [Candidatus Melainabacteria bacterium]|nr:TrmH family RNA methyltransferase [Candidatus Melainabacteria bacterium]
MRTICPYPECSLEFDFPDESLDKRGHFVGDCVHCLKPAAFRNLEAYEIINREFEKRQRQEALSGGPERASDWVAARTVLVEDVRSLWNVGSIFRTADGAGFEHVSLSGITGSPPRKEIEKVSLGAEQVISWDYERNPMVVLNRLKAQNMQIVGLEKNDSSILLSDALMEERIRQPMCLVVGNEVSGLSPQVLSLCELTCHLPMRGMKESLNVAVAYGIAAYMIAQSLDRK